MTCGHTHVALTAEVEDVWYYNPEPPVEFGAYGIDVNVAWRGGRSVVTGNSFAAPHMAAIITLLVEDAPTLSPFEVKAALAALASRPRPDRSGAGNRRRRSSPTVRAVPR